jgi:hypothetical protein
VGVNAPDLSQSASRLREAAEKQAREQAGKAPDPIEATTAFIVYTRKDTGQIVLTHDVNVPLVVERPPTHDEVYGSMHIVIKDIVGQQYAGMTAQASLQLNNFVAGQLQQQQELAPVLQDLSGGLGKR